MPAGSDLSLLALHSGISRSALALSSLDQAQHLINGEADRYNSPHWILSLGHRNRRRAGGLQFCPMCFAEGACFYRIQSRLAWHTVCPKHLCLLADRCHACFSALCPQLLLPQARGLASCHRCSEPLGNAVPLYPGCRALIFQRKADVIVQKESALYGEDWLPRRDWFYLARWLVGLLRTASMRMPKSLALFLQALEVDPSDVVASHSGLRFELLSPLERTRILAGCHSILEAGPEQFIRAACDSGLRSSYAPLLATTTPRCVATLAQSLLYSPRVFVPQAIQRPRSPDTVMKMWHRLLRKSLR